MTTATANFRPYLENPRWYRPLLAWRVVTAVLIGFGLLATTLRRGIVLDGAVRWTLMLALAGAMLAAALAVLRTHQAVHTGRVTGFVIDVLIAVIAAFVGFNRMGMFTGLDAVGEAFNRSAGWLLVIIVGWLVLGFAEKAGGSQRALRTAARWTMAAGLAVLTLAMGLIPGLIEFGSRAIGGAVIPYLAFGAAATLFARFAWSGEAAQFFKTTRTQNDSMEGFLFVAPNVLGFLTFFAGPLLVSLIISFTQWDGLTDATFVGLQNYIDLFSDRLFLRSLRNVVVFSAFAIPLAVVPALVVASLLNSKLPGMKIFRAIYFLPSIAGVVGVTLIWKQLFNSTIGYLNFILFKVTEWTNAAFSVGLEAPQPQWISDANIALIAVIILFVWQQIGFNTVLFLAGMQGLDSALYEAASIDGAGTWRKFISITIPSLRPTTVFVVATTTILALQLFNEPFILQSPSPPAGPGNSTLTPVVYLYQNAFQEFQIGYASAVAWALFILIFGVTLLYFRRGGDDGVLGA